MSAFTEHEQLDDKIIGDDHDLHGGGGAPTHTSSIFDNPFRDHSEYRDILRESVLKDTGVGGGAYAQGARPTAATAAPATANGDEKEWEETEGVQTNPVGWEKFWLHVKRWWWAYTILQILLLACLLPILYVALSFNMADWPTC